ncbi:MAG: hypothetical protein IT371_22940 [Deltaproteobacteria bacterium]|nr:hypothetical protein [Deltaproteobacteria bacterium]
MKRNYLGLACTYHDPAVAVVDSAGRVVFAEATERHLQLKQGVNCAPDQMHRIAELVQEYCDPDVELVVATSWAGPMLPRPVAPLARLLGDVKSSFGRTVRIAGLFDEAQSHAVAQAGLSLAVRHLASGGFGGRVRRLEQRACPHHLAHAYAGCLGAPFAQAVCAVVDGLGEGSSTAFYRYEGGRVTQLAERAPSSMSLGLFFDLACTLCGFDPWKGEHWKVMGLAAYGTPDPEAYALARRLIRVEGLALKPGASPLALLETWNRLWALRLPLGADPLLAKDLAAALQQAFADWMTELLVNLHALGHSDRLVLGGGCALNSSFNGEILDRTPFRELYVGSAPADDGNAVGAALWAFCADHPGRDTAVTLASPYLGSTAVPEALARLERHGGLSSITRLSPAEVPERAAQLLAEGKILGWMQGRAEWGPRALGNRSILADPRRDDIKDEINARVKFREAFRPFAPSILDEHGPTYFEHYQPTPYMERTLKFRPEVMAQVPGVVHVNGTGRLQTVRREWNPRYHALIEAFYRRTGVPIVLNTSFNVMGRPIVHTVEDALGAFFTTGIDALLVEDLLVQKQAGA